MSFAFGSVPSQKGAKTAKLGTWDKPLPTDPIRERMDNGSWEEYKTFSCHPDYRSFSLEEHRLEDYEHDKGRNAAHNVNPNAQSLFATDSKPLIKGTLADKGKIQLLQGSAVEIQAETTTSFSNYDETKSFKTWCLPINLVSHYSPYLKEVISSFKQSGKRISLHGVPPEVFGLFVEWMYYGSYESPSVVSIFNADAKCWVLGDKLRSIEFKNCAMRRLHEQHTRPTFGRPMTCDDVQYVYSNTSPGSQLRSFYKHFVVEHFGSPDKLLGTSSDWDKLLQNQPEIRILLLKKFRESTFLKSHVESIDKYLGPNNRPIVALRQKKKEAVESATGPESAEGPIFNFDEKSNGKKNSPQQTEAFQLVSTTKNYEGAALKSGWKLGESADNSPKPIFKTIQPKQDPISELDAEPVLGHASKCSTCVSKSDDVNKAPETEKGKEPMRGECLDNKKSELDEASTLLG